MPQNFQKIHKVAEEWLGNIKLINSSLGKIEYDCVYELRYEDLVREPTIETKKVCKLLGENFDSKMLKYHQKKQRRGARAKRVSTVEKKDVGATVRRSSRSLPRGPHAR